MLGVFAMAQGILVIYSSTFPATIVHCIALHGFNHNDSLSFYNLQALGQLERIMPFESFPFFIFQDLWDFDDDSALKSSTSQGPKSQQSQASTLLRVNTTIPPLLQPRREKKKKI